MSEPDSLQSNLMATSAPSAPLQTARQRAYLLAMFIDTLGSGLWMPLGLIFFTRAQQLPLAEVGVALTVGGLCGLVMGPIGGSLIDHFGPGGFILLSNVARAVTFMLYPLVHAAWQVAILAAVFQAADRLFWSANTPLLADLVQGRKLDNLLATQNVIRIVGLGVGAGVSGVFVGSVQGLHLLAYVNAASYVLAAIIICFTVNLTRKRVRAAASDAGSNVDPPADRQSGWRATIADRPFVLLCGIQTLFALSANSLVSILPLVAIYPLGGPAWLPGASIVGGNIMLALAQKPAIAFSTRTSRLRGLLLASVTFAVAFLLIAPAAALNHALVVPLVLATATIGVIGEALFGPLMTAAANDAAPKHLRGRYSSLFQTSWGLSNALAPALFTSLLSIGNSVLWLTAAGIALLTVPGLLFVANRLPRASLRC